MNTSPALVPILTLSLALGLGPAMKARAEDAPKPICADRPTKGTSPCTADPGHWQVEIDAADWSHDRSGGQTTDLSLFASTNFKYGVSDRFDLELNLTPYAVQSGAGGRRLQGFGDMTARAKISLIAGANAVSIAPFVKLPTAGTGLGNGAVEGGVVVPIALTLPAALTLTLDPEIDALKDGNGQGRHGAYVLAAGLSRPLSATLTGSVELWGSRNDDPAGRQNQASFDLGLSWIPARQPALQLDGGVNLGLSKDTPDIQVYVGVSRRF